jgi:tRNA(fMet)-specific endonuclease VapC
MRRYLLDTGIASDLINKRGRIRERVGQEARRGNRVGICTPVLGEILGGVEYSSSREKNLKQVDRALNSLVIWPFDELAAEGYGRIFASLRRKGRPMQQVDMQIASIAISLGRCTVVSKDSDFYAITGLKVEDWTA